jgi:hypothetical protein
MNKKLALALFAIVAALSTQMITAVPVHAYTYHGATSSWERSGHYEWGSITYYGIDLPSGSMWITCEGTALQDTYINTHHVDAMADVQTVTVYVYWQGGSQCIGWGCQQNVLECKLYVNGNYVATGTSGFPYSQGWERFDFAVDVDAGDDLDVDIKFVVEVQGSGIYPGWGTIAGQFTQVVFVSY